MSFRSPHWSSHAVNEALTDLNVRVVLRRRKVGSFNEVLALPGNHNELVVLSFALLSAMLSVKMVLGIGGGDSCGE